MLSAGGGQCLWWPRQLFVFIFHVNNLYLKQINPSVAISWVHCFHWVLAWSLALLIKPVAIDKCFNFCKMPFLLHKIIGWSQRYPEKFQPFELLIARSCVSCIGQYYLGILLSVHTFFLAVWLCGCQGGIYSGSGTGSMAVVAPDISSTGLESVLFASVPMETTVR